MAEAAAEFRIERVGHHYMGYTKNKLGQWVSLFGVPTIMSSVLGALEREISDAAVKL